MADDEVQISEAVGDDSVMSSAVFELSSSVFLLESFNEAFDITWLDVLLDRAREYHGVLCNLNVDSEFFGLLFRQPVVGE